MGGEPRDTGADIGTAVDDEGLQARGDDLPVEVLDEDTVCSDGHIVLGMGETLLNGERVVVAPAPVFQVEGVAPVSDLGEGVIVGNVGM
jgi:hypothetical protein